MIHLTTSEYLLSCYWEDTSNYWEVLEQLLSILWELSELLLSSAKLVRAWNSLSYFAQMAGVGAKGVGHFYL